jgi:L-fuconolactonase
MPDFPVIDCHVHFCDPSRIDYPWLATVPPIAGTYLPHEFDKACGTVTVDRIVFVEVDAAEGQAFDEAVFVAGIAGTDGQIGGIVASARLERGVAAAEKLDRLVTVRGIKGTGKA